MQGSKHTAARRRRNAEALRLAKQDAARQAAIAHLSHDVDDLRRTEAEIIDALTERAADHLGTAVVCALLAHDGRWLEPRSHRTAPAVDGASSPLPAVGVSRPLARAGRPIAVGDSGDAERDVLVAAAKIRPGRRAAGHTTLLRSGNRLLGVLVSANRPRGEAAGAVDLDEADRTFLDKLCRRAAGAIEATRLREELEARAMQQSLVAALGQRALSGAAIEVLLNEMTAAIRTCLQVAYVAYVEAAADGTMLLRAEAGDGDDGTPVRWRNVPGGMVEFGLSASGAVICNDLRAETRFDASHVVDGLGAESCVIVPIGGPDRVGLIAVHSKARRWFTDADADFLASAANVIAAALKRREAERATRYLALHDPLTSLANRLLLNDHIEEALATRRGPRREVALLLMDLDRFKEVNDTLGHHMGDALLAAVAGRLRAAVPPSATVARLGGDEFAVLLPDLTDVRDAAVGQCQAVLDALSRPFAVEGLSLAIDASIGIAVSPDHGTMASRLLQSADIAMYRAKKHRTGFALYDADTDAADVRRLTMASELREAADAGQLHCAYQPKFSLADGRLVGAEALLRWDHPTRGVLMPDAFIGVAEASGAIGSLSWWVLESAVEQAATWARRGLALPVAVNCSARVLHDRELVDRVAAELERRGVAGTQLLLEITESSVMLNPELALGTVDALSELGVGVSIDDFGTGYSSLAYLQQLPAVELKIDRSFVSEVAVSVRDAAIVKAVIDLGHQLGMSVVAEGVESSDALVALRRLGCDVAQGYVLSPPVDAGQIEVLGQRRAKLPSAGRRAPVVDLNAVSERERH